MFILASQFVCSPNFRRCMKLQLSGQSIPELPPLPAVRRGFMVPEQNDNEIPRDYRIRIFNELLKWQFRKYLIMRISWVLIVPLGGVQVVFNTIIRGSLLDHLYQYKLRIVNFNPDGTWTAKNGTFEFNPKEKGNGRATKAMIEPWMRNMEGGGIRLEVQEWSDGKQLYADVIATPTPYSLVFLR